MASIIKTAPYILRTVAAMGFTNAAANLLSAAPYALGFISTLATAVVSDRLGVRGPFIIGEHSNQTQFPSVLTAISK